MTSFSFLSFKTDVYVLQKVISKNTLKKNQFSLASCQPLTEPDQDPNPEGFFRLASG
jgi:hypothetical protein